MLLSLCLAAVLLPMPGSATRARSIYRLKSSDTYVNGKLSSYTLYDYVYDDLLYSKKEYHVSNGVTTLWSSEINQYNNVPELQYREETLNGTKTIQRITTLWPEENRSVETIEERVEGESGSVQVTRETRYNANGRPISVWEKQNGIYCFSATYTYTKRGQVKDYHTTERSPIPNMVGESVLWMHHEYDRYGNDFPFHMDNARFYIPGKTTASVITHETVDANGELITFTIDLNDEHVTAYYDHRLLVRSVREYADGGVTTQDYDADNNCIRSTYKGSDGRTTVTEYTSDWFFVPAEPTFSDVSVDEYYFNPVEWAVETRVTKGTSFSTFSPDATCTRGQVVTFLWRAMGGPEPETTVNPFQDVSPDAYYYKAVLWASEQGITNGTSNTMFSPDAPCTRAHVVTFLWRAEGQTKASGKNPFADVAGGQYYYDAVLWAVSKNITQGTSATTFGPDSPCTRAQIVTFLYRDLYETF